MNMLPRETNTLLRKKPVSSKVINQSIDMHACDYKLDRNKMICRKCGFRSLTTINPNVRALTYFERAYIAKLPRLISKMAQLSVFIITFSAFLDM